jgi:hypothetical protein
VPPKALRGAVTFCETIIMDGSTGVAVARICGKRADSTVMAPSGEVYVCDEHAADFAPKPGRATIRIGEVPR